MPALQIPSYSSNKDVATFRRLQAEAREWTARNFADQQPWHYLLGVVEELGELQEASASNDRAGMTDAIADAAIFLAGYCSQMQVDMGMVWLHALAEDGSEDSLRFQGVGRLCKAHLKLSQGIRGTREQHVGDILRAAAAVLNELSWAAELLGDALPALAMRVWAEVRERDWRAYPGDGKTV